MSFGMRCREAGVRPSMGSVGDCFDNAMCESFFATLDDEARTILADIYNWFAEGFDTAN